MTSAFAGYNKNNGKGTLVGNWVEEEALRSATGFARRKVPLSVHEPESNASKWESTHNRVLLHAKENGQATFETTNQARTNYGDGVIRVAPGPRSSSRETELMEKARQLRQEELTHKQREEERERQHLIAAPTSHVVYQAPDNATLLASARVPRGRNGARVVDTTVQHLTRAEVDSLDTMKLNVLQQATTYTQGVAVTRYSHALTTGVGVDFCTTTSDSTNPFGRSSTFSNDIRDPTKRHGEAMEPGSDKDERIGMSVHQRSGFIRLLHMLRQDASRLPRLTDRLLRVADGDYVELPVFRAALADSNETSLALTEREAIHIFMHFDLDHIGTIRLSDFLAFCHNPPAL
ncbi:hypothetical protein Poli38472_005666 [Pythium oligandrum]|uniref:Uncharacterized protein n=1 Tax=Pythium oligandrum TaxID=41045 RepID=A0A8K1CHF5_PYTOL|nr:hypothetical protein Poli38472_005666 [Pythium oligandrum]|eukprot:TMW63048.1 hypothetical protein Poli38472_005666 [Pythium oligandrum]